MQRFSWSWATLLFGSHFVRDLIPAQPAPRAPLSAEVLELRLQIVATTELLSWHSESVQNADRRLFWQGLVLRASILLDVILSGLSLWLWLGRFRAPAEAIEEPPSPVQRSSVSYPRAPYVLHDDSAEASENGPTRPSDLK